MAYRYGDRYQLGLLPQNIEEYVGASDPVRAYDAFVEALDFKAFGIALDPHRVGNSQYDPQAMLKLLVYGYSYGIKSSRKLERACHHNLSFIWLMGGLKPDHKSIAEYRRRHKGAIKQVLKQCVRICLQLGLIAGNVLFVDGSRIRANASRGKSYDEGHYERVLSEIDARIERLLQDCEGIDQQEAEAGSYVQMDQELGQAKRMREKVQQALERLRDSGTEEINLTDTDCAMMRSPQGTHASYNVQSVVDDAQGLIVHAEAVSESTDVNQFARQIEGAQEVLGKRCEVGCADAGYADSEELRKIDEQGIKVIVPSQRQALHKGEKPFSKSRFIYDPDEDCYRCPVGKRLRYVGTDRTTGKRHYRVTDSAICRSCEHYGVCTRSRSGRKIIRLADEAIKVKLEAQYEQAQSQQIYARRKCRVEHPFGHIKRNLKTDAFLMRGRAGVGAETSLLASCFNLARMISILGVSELVAKLTNLPVPMGG